MRKFKECSTKPEREKINAWLDALSEEKLETGWDELVNETNSGSSEDSEESDMEVDGAEELHKDENTFIKMASLEVDDSFGMMFDRPLYGRVVSKNKKSIKAQFYSRATRTTDEYHCRNPKSHSIPIDQQGFIFYHYDKVKN